MLGIYTVGYQEESTFSNNYRDGGEVTTAVKGIVDEVDNNYDDENMEEIVTTEKDVVDGAQHAYGEEVTTTESVVVAEADNDYDDGDREEILTTEKGIVNEADNDYVDVDREDVTTEKGVVEGAHHDQDQVSISSASGFCA